MGGVAGLASAMGAKLAPTKTPLNATRWARFLAAGLVCRTCLPKAEAEADGFTGTRQIAERRSGGMQGGASSSSSLWSWGSSASMYLVG